MYKQANISFFESLGNTREKVVVYDQNVQNGLGSWLGNLKNRFNMWRLGGDMGDPQMVSLFHMVNGPMRQIHNEVFDTRKTLMASVSSGATDIQAAFRLLDDSYARLTALMGKYQQAIKAARNYLIPKQKKTPANPPAGDPAGASLA